MPNLTPGFLLTAPVIIVKNAPIIDSSSSKTANAARAQASRGLGTREERVAWVAVHMVTRAVLDVDEHVAPVAPGLDVPFLAALTTGRLHARARLACVRFIGGVAHG